MKAALMQSAQFASAVAVAKIMASHGNHMNSNFCINEYWHNQEMVSLYHGTALSKLDSILANGLTPGHDGKIYLTSSPAQAAMYAHMGGECDYLKSHKALLPDSETVIIEVKVSPASLSLNGSPNFQSEIAFNKVRDLVIEHFSDDKDALMLEFTTCDDIRPNNITEIEKGI